MDSSHVVDSILTIQSPTEYCLLLASGWSKPYAPDAQAEAADAHTVDVDAGDGTLDLDRNFSTHHTRTDLGSHVKVSGYRSQNKENKEDNGQHVFEINVN